MSITNTAVRDLMLLCNSIVPFEEFSFSGNDSNESSF